MDPKEADYLHVLGTLRDLPGVIDVLDIAWPRLDLGGAVWCTSRGGGVEYQESSENGDVLIPMIDIEASGMDGLLLLADSVTAEVRDMGDTLIVFSGLSKAVNGEMWWIRVGAARKAEDEKC